MTWTAIEAVRRGNNGSPVTVKVTPKSRAGLSRLVISVRLAKLPKLAWWRADKDVAALIGADEHAGQIRVQAGGPFRLSTVGPHQGKVIALFLPLPREIVCPQSRRTDVEFSIESGGLEIRLPKHWLTPAQPVAVRDAPAAAPPAGRPFRTAATAERMPAGMVGGR